MTTLTVEQLRRMSKPPKYRNQKYDQYGHAMGLETGDDGKRHYRCWWDARGYTCDGKPTFDSERELLRGGVLTGREAAGEIRDVRHHPPAIRLEVNGKLVQRYTADWSYVVVATGERVLEDVKPASKFRTAAWRRTRRLLEALGFTVVEV